MSVAFLFDILVGKVIIGRKSNTANVSYIYWYLLLELSFNRSILKSPVNTRPTFLDNLLNYWADV